MEQLNIYHEIGITYDPIYSSLVKLNLNESILIESLIITKNAKGLFELECKDDFHISAKNEFDCYNKINSYLSPVIGTIF